MMKYLITYSVFIYFCHITISLLAVMCGRYFATAGFSLLTTEFVLSVFAILVLLIYSVRVFRINKNLFIYLIVRFMILLLFSLLQLYFMEYLPHFLLWLGLALGVGGLPQPLPPATTDGSSYFNYILSNSILEIDSSQGSNPIAEGHGAPENDALPMGQGLGQGLPENEALPAANDMQNDAPLAGLPLDPIAAVRLMNYEVETRLMIRIQYLEGMLIEGIPPQINPGGYASLVRGFLAESYSVDDYIHTLNREITEVSILEYKAYIVEFLVSLLRNDPVLDDLINNGGINQRDLNGEAQSFIEEQLSRLGAADPSSPLERIASRALLKSYAQNLYLSGSNSYLYNQFRDYLAGL